MRLEILKNIETQVRSKDVRVLRVYIFDQGQERSYRMHIPDLRTIRSSKIANGYTADGESNE